MADNEKEKGNEAFYAKDCEHALAICPKYMKGLHRKGKALYELKRYEEAVKYFQMALAESPGNTQINGDLMVARRKLRAVPSPPPQRSAVSSSTVRIEELDPDTELSHGPGGPATQPPPPAANYTRVMIEEDSDSE